MRAFSINIPRRGIIFTTASILYLALIHLLTGVRPEHFMIVVLMNLLYWSGNGTRKFILGFLAFAVFGILYDVMRAFPNYQFNDVDIAGLYHFEKKIFGIMYEGFLLTPNEYFDIIQSETGDFLSGFFYINWMPVPLAFAVWLYHSDRRNFLHFSLTFLFVNLIGFCIYYLHPAAPPWYVQHYGFGLHLDTPGSTANLSRFDELIHFGLFNGIYSKNANVFAALPSLHCAYPVIVLYYASLSRPRWLVFPLTLFMLGIWFAAVYSGHHYVTDVVLGILCAIAGLLLYRFWLMKSRAYKRFFERYLGMIR